MVIRKDQFQALAEAWKHSQRANFVSQLRQEFAEQVRNLSDADLLRQVEDGCKAAGALAITESGHIYRFLRLRYLEAAAGRQLLAEELLTRVLTDTAIEAGRRLQFIETSILATK